MDETTEPGVEQLDSYEDVPSEYSTETPEAAGESYLGQPVATGPASGTGRRKQAIARVRIVPGTGQWKINGRTLDQYFPNKVHQQVVNEPFVLLGLEGQFDVLARVNGGGTSGQAGALRLGIARALQTANIEHRPALKKAGFLTRDARKVERKKYGQPGARKRFQFSKR